MSRHVSKQANVRCKRICTSGNLVEFTSRIFCEGMDAGIALASGRRPGAASGEMLAPRVLALFERSAVREKTEGVANGVGITRP